MNAKTAGWVLVVLIVTALFAVPIAAQSDDQQGLVVVDGVFTVALDGTIMVGDYIIAPANAFIPALPAEGDMVLVVGYLLPDDATIQALSIEIEDASTVASDRSSTDGQQPDTITIDTIISDHGQGNGQGNEHGNGNHGNGNGQGNGRGNGHGNGNHGNGNRQGNSSERGFYCEHTEIYHPAAERLAAEFDVPYGEVITHFCEGGQGFGQILIAYRLAAVSGQSVQALLDLRNAGEGWGRIMRDLEVNPGEVMGNGNSRSNANR